jgi:SAM-dependent methyltransferase
LQAEFHAGRASGPIIVLGSGSGRNFPPLLGAGLTLTAVDDDPERSALARRRFADRSGITWVASSYAQLPHAPGGYGAALSTHALLHGTRAKAKSIFAEIFRVLRPGAPLFVTLGSIHDARYGVGEAIDVSSFAPVSGEEQGVPHVFFEEDGVRDLARRFAVESLEEVDADTFVGRWAHGSEAAGRRHWFLVARKS